MGKFSNNSKIPQESVAEDADDEGDDGEGFDGNGEDTDDEDAPDYLFDEGEKVTKDPEYVFCPAAHRGQILRLFTRHFCRHPLFIRETGKQQTPMEIHAECVRQMYDFCHARGLAEVWAYSWTQWYAPSMWKLWARSTLSSSLSRLRTTMTAQNHWKQMKHDHLHFLNRPRLDLTVYTIISKVVPTYVDKSARLEDSYRLSRSKALTPYQKAFKTAWRDLETRACGSRDYKTNVAKWICRCGAQELQAHHLCKHLVQAAGKPPVGFFRQISRRRAVPLYRHQHLKNTTNDPGSITDGDDHVWSGQKNVMEQGNWRDIPTRTLKRPVSPSAVSSRSTSGSLPELPSKKVHFIH